MTGHVTKVGTGFVVKNENKKTLSSSTIATAAADAATAAKAQSYRTSVKGLISFLLSAIVANILCSILERSTSTTVAASSLSFINNTILFQLLRRLPLGTTLAVVYSILFRWYYVSLSLSSSSGNNNSSNYKKQK
jgi:hypothetical protein